MDCTPGSIERGRGSQADLLIKLADELGVELVHDPGKVAYAVVRQGDVRAVHGINTSSFRSLLAKEFFDRHEKVPRAAALSDARSVLEGRAVHAGSCVDVALRIAGDDESIDIDLGDDLWRMAHVTKAGWTVKSHGRRLFRRAPGMLTLPKPIRGANLSELREFIHVDDDEYPLLLAFLVNAIRPRGPYPILLLTGEQGSAKTTTARILRCLVDPNKADVRAEARDNRDVAIAAKNAHMIVLDNISHLSAQMSDALCRLSTGGGFSTRTLYTDDEETIFDGQRPIVLTSIADVANRPDLLDRSLMVRLQSIPERERRTEGELWREFAAAHAGLFGALLDAVSVALRNVYEIDHKVQSKPRMADAFIWALAAASALDVNPGAVAQAWNRTRDDAYASTIESSLIAGPLIRLVENTSPAWTGTASAMQPALAGLVADATLRRREWPKSPKALAGQVRVIAPALRAAGVDHTEKREPGTGARLHTFTLTKNVLPTASHASLTSYKPDDGEVRDTRSESVIQGRVAGLCSVTNRHHICTGCDECDDNSRGLFEGSAKLAKDDEVLPI